MRVKVLFCMAIVSCIPDTRRSPDSSAGTYSTHAERRVARKIKEEDPFFTGKAKERVTTQPPWPKVQGGSQKREQAGKRKE
jgi:hypothetical protein